MSDTVETLAALRTLPGVRDAVVTERAGPDGRRLILGYVTGTDPALDSAGIRQRLLTQLPVHLIPEHVAVLDALPLTPQGEYDLDALPDPPVEGAADNSVGRGHVAPRTPMEQQLADIFSKLLDVERVGVYDSFFSLGGSSLQATTLTRRVRETFDVELSLPDVFASPTVDGITQLVVRTLGERAGARKLKGQRWRQALRRLENDWRRMHARLPLLLRRWVPPGVPCGRGARSFTEYQAMFALSDEDLGGSVLDCRGGMASFVAELSARGVPAVAADPAYDRTHEELVALVAGWLKESAAVADEGADRYVWHWYGSPDQRNQLRQNAAAAFLDDIRKDPSRYVAASLPRLPFPDSSFDLVLCSHALFASADRTAFNGHLAALTELIRVSRREVRVYPLVVPNTGDPVPYLNDLRDALEAAGHTTEVRGVGFEFLRGANEMLSISRRELNGSR